jgi:hypothetical protein
MIRLRPDVAWDIGHILPEAAGEGKEKDNFIRCVKLLPASVKKVLPERDRFKAVLARWHQRWKEQQFVKGSSGLQFAISAHSKSHVI